MVMKVGFWHQYMFISKPGVRSNAVLSTIAIEGLTSMIILFRVF